jgi:hypothetical protein
VSFIQNPGIDDHIPAAPSLVLSGENFSAIIVKSKDGSASCKQIALETPMIPAPIIATFFLLNCDIWILEYVLSQGRTTTMQKAELITISTH